ncbi:MAG: SDR family oxidoreductase [Pseudomonadota bacterium]
MTSVTSSNGQANFPGLEGQRVLVTAGASGIGFAIARALAAQGAQLAICDIDEAQLEKAATDLGVDVACVVDVTNAHALDRLFQILERDLGGLDGVINNAGVAGPTAPIESIDDGAWRQCIDVCLTGQFLVTKRAVPLLKASPGGSIVNMSSAAGKHGYALRTPYAAAKFGVIGLTESLAKELGPDNIRVNAILPGFVEGPRMDAVIANKAKATGVSVADMQASYLKAVSLRRMVRSEDVANMVCFLLSDAGTNISGQSLAVDGNVEYL